MHIGALWVGTATKNRESGANSQRTVWLPIRLVRCHLLSRVLPVAIRQSLWFDTGTINLPVNHYLLLKAF